MSRKADSILQEELVKRNVANKGVITALFKEAAKTGETFSSVLLKRNVAPEKDILDILAEKLGMPYVDLRSTEVDRSVTERIPIKVASYYKMVPLKIENRVLTVAVSYPFDIKTLDDIRVQTGYDVELVLAEAESVAEAI